MTKARLLIGCQHNGAGNCEGEAVNCEVAKSRQQQQHAMQESRAVELTSALNSNEECSFVLFRDTITRREAEGRRLLPSLRAIKRQPRLQQRMSGRGTSRLRRLPSSDRTGMRAKKESLAGWCCCKEGKRRESSLHVTQGKYVRREIASRDESLEQTQETNKEQTGSQ